MVHKVKVLKETEFNYQGVFDFNDFISYLKNFFKRYNYDITEKSYSSSTNEGLKNLKIKWECDRKLDDYNHAYIKVKIKLNDYKEAAVKSAKVVDGKLKLEAEAEIKRDYDSQWKGGAARIFLRSVYDKYIAAGKQKDVESEVKKTAENFLSDAKHYLNVK